MATICMQCPPMVCVEGMKCCRKLIASYSQLFFYVWSSYSFVLQLTTYFHLGSGKNLR